MTLDEEENLPRCLQSVAGLADEIVVVDSGSTDRTREIASEAGATVIVRPFTGYVDQRQFALDQGRCDWVLCLDADEWLDEPLREAVAGIVATTPDGGLEGYQLNRYTVAGRPSGGCVCCGVGPPGSVASIRMTASRSRGGSDACQVGCVTLPTVVCPTTSSR
jgi:glycosyltransferase involved in cell wall biosynthesis